MSQRVQAVLGKRPVFLDTETTGFGPRDEVVEIGIVDFDGQTLLQSLVRPLGPLPQEATRIHGITDAMVSDAPEWPQVWPLIEQAVEGRLVAIYNAEFDLRLMQQSHRQHSLSWPDANMDWICVMNLYAEFYGQWNHRRQSYRWQKLSAAGRQCGIALPNSHRAVDDALLARAVLEHMASSHA